MSDATSRARQKRTYEKRSITLPPDLAEAVREQMRARGLPSFSAYVAEAILRDLETRRFDELLEEMFAEQPRTDGERAWAGNALYGQAERQPSNDT